MSQGKNNRIERKFNRLDAEDKCGAIVRIMTWNSLAQSKLL